MWTKKTLTAGVVAAALMTGGCQTEPSRDHAVITAPDLPAIGPYSHAIRANGFLFVSGVVPYDPTTQTVIDGDFSDQMHHVFNTLQKILVSGGATLQDVVKVSVFLKDPADFKRMNDIYVTYFPDYKPARTTVPGVDWGTGFLVEIDVIARVPE